MKTTITDDIPEILLEEIRRAAMIVFIRRARNRSTVITACGECAAFLAEHAIEGEGRVEAARCPECVSLITIN